MGEIEMVETDEEQEQEEDEEGKSEELSDGGGFHVV